MRIVCLGDSITKGQLGVDYVAVLRRRVDAEVIQDGVNGDLAYNLLQRLDAAVAHRPDVVTVLIGTNDVRAAIDPEHARVAMRRKRLPERPTIQGYQRNLSDIVRRLRDETGARIGLLSLPVLGQAPAQEQATEYSGVVREVAAEFGAGYLPLHERQLADLGEARPRSYGDAHRLRNTAVLQRLILRRSWDDISRRNGLELTTDLIHQNSRGAGHVADVIAEFVRS
ncbi:SGNH/GDSL hydrolase family protein [Dactylosporangium sp. AC04546]|uniref:SGNH/GDSL hydrolase family protein n=1 Tax=Dactylosporangium sp. AC04546 TaxID=2862460 RepID=UPI001EE089C1|nr:SGNH/GDSL hydrolase family protein [Dactylosporangium sp. AC04546]WVK88013.1 SGNH/GDSL hydrolase family protein [Dactylosporangium sp. AC04546]